MGPPLQGMYPLIRPSVCTGAPSPLGEGFWAAQIGKNSAFCGTFEYIYWELGRSAPVGRRAAQCAAPTAETWQARAARREAAPYKRCGSRPRPCGGIWAKNGGRTMCAPTWRGGGNLAPHPPPPGAPFPIPSVPSGHLPLTRGVGPQGEGLGKTKRDRFLTCPLKHRGETQFRTKFLCLLSFSKKVGYTGPWRKRSIISWVREMAEPPWGRFSRSNQVPSPSSSSWRVTVSSSVSRSQ